MAARRRITVAADALQFDYARMQKQSRLVQQVVAQTDLQPLTYTQSQAES